MLDMKFVRDHLDEVQAMLERRHNPMKLDDFSDLEKRRREILGEVEALKGKRNAASKEISVMKKNGENADEGEAEENAEAPQDEKTEADEPKAEAPKDDETKAESPKVEEAKAEPPKDGEVKDGEEKAEPPKADETKTDEPPKADVAKDGGAAPVEEAAAPRKNLSLVDAAVEVLRAEKRPMGVKELVKLATERGLWIPTKAKTPEQSLYGGLYLEMKNSAHPRVKKSAEKGRFELIG